MCPVVMRFSLTARIKGNRRDRRCVSQPSFSVGFQPAYIQLNVTDKFIRSRRQTGLQCSYCSIAEISQHVGALGPSKNDQPTISAPRRTRGNFLKWWINCLHTDPDLFSSYVRFRFVNNHERFLICTLKEGHWSVYTQTPQASVYLAWS